MARSRNSIACAANSAAAFDKRSGNVPRAKADPPRADAFRINSSPGWIMGFPASQARRRFSAGRPANAAPVPARDRSFPWHSTPGAGRCASSPPDRHKTSGRRDRPGSRSRRARSRRCRSARRDLLLENPRTLVDHRIHHALDDLLVADHAALAAESPTSRRSASRLRDRAAARANPPRICNSPSPVFSPKRPASHSASAISD